jgi:hypothetical protein
MLRDFEHRRLLLLPSRLKDFAMSSHRGNPPLALSGRRAHELVCTTRDLLRIVSSPLAIAVFAVAG